MRVRGVGWRVRAFALAVVGLAVVWAVVRFTRPRHERVVLRLGPADFGQPAASTRLPMVEVRSEARTVVAAPERVAIIPPRKVVPEAGVVRATATLPDGAQNPSIDSLVVSMLGTRPHAADEIELGAQVIHWRVMDDWELRRDPRAPQAITLTVRGIDAPSESLQLQVHALTATPSVLVSRPFDMPPGARLEVGYAVVHAPRRAAPLEVGFEAEIRCRDARRTAASERVVVRNEDRPPWRDLVVRLRRGGHECRLRLVAETASETIGAVWTTPVIVAPELPAKKPGAPRPRNLVLISLDTLRADHLSGYGYVRPTSPAIDTRLIAAGTTFVDVSTTFPLTNIAHRSLFTGLYPESEPPRAGNPPASPAIMLAESFRDAGFATAAFTEDAFMSGIFGFWDGFDRYTERPFVGPARGRDTFRDGAAFLRACRDRPFFVFLHTYKVHSPYEFGPEYAALFTDRSASPGMDAGVPHEHRPKMDAYDRAIRNADAQVAEFLDALDDLGLSDETLVVLLSDHGEAFGEHGLVGHGAGGHEEQLRVPFVLRGPGIPPGRRIAEPVSLIDVAPTLLDLMNVPGPREVDGVSLRTAITGGATPSRPLFFAWLRGGAKGVRFGRCKALGTPTSVEVFDLASDPHERLPLTACPEPGFEADRFFAAHRAATEIRRRALASTGGALVESASAPGLSPEVERSLRALGYVE